MLNLFLVVEASSINFKIMTMNLPKQTTKLEMRKKKYSKQNCITIRNIYKINFPEGIQEK